MFEFNTIIIIIITLIYFVLDNSLTTFNYLLLFCLIRFTKPQSFADCVGNELPLGWEETVDPVIGVYYINHFNRTFSIYKIKYNRLAMFFFFINFQHTHGVLECTQLEDPRLEWRAVQEAMLRDYLHVAQDVLEVSTLFMK